MFGSAFALTSPPLAPKFRASQTLGNVAPLGPDIPENGAQREPVFDQLAPTQTRRQNPPHALGF